MPPPPCTHTRQHGVHPLTACLRPNPTLHWDSHESFHCLQSEGDHSAGGNFIPTTLQFKKSFLRLLHFMGGNIIQRPLSLAWSHFKSCVGYTTSEMHAGCTRRDVLHLFWAEVRTSLKISCRLITGSVYLLAHTMPWPVPCFSGWAAAGSQVFKKILGSEMPTNVIVQRASRGSGAGYGLNSWKWGSQLCSIMQRSSLHRPSSFFLSYLFFLALITAVFGS